MSDFIKNVMGGGKANEPVAVQHDSGKSRHISPYDPYLVANMSFSRYNWTAF